MQPQNIAQQPPDFGKIVEQQVMNMKKRTSQIKGELTDGLTEINAKNFEQFYQIATQLVAQITMRDKQIEELNKTLEKYESAHPELKIKIAPKIDNGKATKKK